MTVAPAQRVEEFEKLQATTPANFALPFSVDGVFKTAAPHIGLCLRWPATNMPSELRLPRNVASPSMPVLVINGDLDLQTSLNGAFLAASQFTNSVMVKVPNAPHAVIPAVPCILGVAFTFLDDLALPPADACLDQVVPIP
jgi:pimeloyl-ACP methyl ester carboxylesterase